ncbi:MAG: helix-turn-helix transcriptional regulator [Clostridia bacterium]|nr:helix-turn-helix transcriptional regulator [Clostridia bacterium]
MEWISTWENSTAESGAGISAFHIHNVCEMLYLYQGSATMRIGSTRYTLQPHQLAIIGRMELHDLIPTQYPYSRIGFHVDPDALARIGIPPQLSVALLQHPSHWCHCFDLQEHPRVYRLIKELEEEINGNHPYKQDMLGVLFHQLLLYLYRLYPDRFEQVVKDTEMEQAKRYIEEHCADFTSVKQLSASNYLTESHFIVRFKKYTGYTPYHYRTLCQMTQARRMLMQNDLSLNEVAERCGFSDLNGFVRRFREIMNITPGKFRELSRRQDFET